MGVPEVRRQLIGMLFGIVAGVGLEFATADRTRGQPTSEGEAAREDNTDCLNSTELMVSSDAFRERSFLRVCTSHPDENPSVAESDAPGSNFVLLWASSFARLFNQAWSVS